MRSHDTDSETPTQSHLAIIEHAMMETWRQEKVFEQSLRLRADGEPWVFWEGPPTANGKPGSHHVLARAFKDVFCRFQSMNGKNVQRKAGWDCHGLPVELGVEKQLGLHNKQDVEAYGLAAFNDQCQASVDGYLDDWNRLTERVGYWVDLQSPYQTMDLDYMDSVWSAFGALWDRGLVYHAHRVAAHCPRCESTLSSHEVSQGYRDVRDLSATVVFTVTDAANSPLHVGDQVLAWTTTPWTLPNNTLLAVGAELSYVRVVHDGVTYVVAHEALDRLKMDPSQVVDQFSGASLVGVEYEPPFDFVDPAQFGANAHQVVTADFVSADGGTGVVHLAPAFGVDDYEVARSHGLPLVNSVRLDGTFNVPQQSQFDGRFVKDCDVELTTELQRRGKLFAKQGFMHSYPHCWRCQSPLLYYAKSSWYVNTSDARQYMSDANQTVQWHPEHIKNGRFGNWLNGAVDWAVSRERYWGTPLPVWQCDNDACTRRVCLSSRRELEERTGATLTDLHRQHVDDLTWECDRCNGHMRRTPEVLDVWFDSGCVPFAQHGLTADEAVQSGLMPADYVCEALDQTRGWFYSLMALSTLLTDQAPYKHVVCLGLLLDEEGQKMSKSRGNVVDPWDVVEPYGADALRLFFFGSKQPWDGYRFSAEKVGEYAMPFFNTLKNTLSFLTTYGAFDVDDSYVTSTEEQAMDRWLYTRTQSLVQTVTTALNTFDATEAARAVESFVDEVSNWYVRLSRPRFWAGDAAALKALRQSLSSLAQVMAPLCPFYADHMWRELGNRNSVHLTDWPLVQERDQTLETDMKAVQEVVTLGLAARAGAKMKLRQPLAEMTVVATDQEGRRLARYDSLMCRELNVHRVTFTATDDTFVTTVLKPNFRTLGPKLGKQMGMVAQQVTSLPAAQTVQALAHGESVPVSLGDTTYQLTEDDVLVEYHPQSGYHLSSDRQRTVALDVNLTTDLVNEGLYRELARRVQSMRKDAEYSVDQRVTVTVAADEALTTALQAHQVAFYQTTLTSSLTYRALTEDDQPTDLAGHPLVVLVQPTDV